MELAQFHRERLIEKFVKDGQSWSRARRGYEMTLAMQSRAVTMMAGWLGGSFVNRDKKGDPGNRPPIEVVPAKTQRAALRFILDTTFRDEAYGLNSDLLRRMTIDKWWDDGSAFQDPTWPVHDRIMGIQSMVLTRVMNPGDLGRVYDNEFVTPSTEDMVTLPEVLDTVEGAIWVELDAGEGRYTARQPMISSLRRNLQREYVERLIDLSMPDSWGQASHKPIGNLAMMHLRQLGSRLNQTLATRNNDLDPYSKAHLTEAKIRIEKALDAGYVLNGGGAGQGISIMLMLGQTNAPALRR